MTERAETLTTCDRCGATARTQHGKPKGWHSLLMTQTSVYLRHDLGLLQVESTGTKQWDLCPLCVARVRELLKEKP